MRLRAEELAAEELMMKRQWLLAKQQQDLMELFAWISRLRRQQDLLKTCGLDMLRKDAALLDDLDEKERKEVEEKARQEELE